MLIPSLTKLESMNVVTRSFLCHKQDALQVVHETPQSPFRGQYEDTFTAGFVSLRSSSRAD